jgi:hypothetical protein
MKPTTVGSRNEPIRPMPKNQPTAVGSRQLHGFTGKVLAESLSKLDGGPRFGPADIGTLGNVCHW